MAATLTQAQMLAIIDAGGSISFGDGRVYDLHNRSSVPNDAAIAAWLAALALDDAVNTTAVSAAITAALLAAGVTSVTFPGSGTLATTGDLSQFAATTSLQLKTLISDETGSGPLVFGTSPTLTTPVLASAGASGVVYTASGVMTASVLLTFDGVNFKINGISYPSFGVYDTATGKSLGATVDGSYAYIQTNGGGALPMKIQATQTLHSGSIGVGNSVTATGPAAGGVADATMVRKMQVFDASGASLGYIPIYSALT